MIYQLTHKCSEIILKLHYIIKPPTNNFEISREVMAMVQKKNREREREREVIAIICLTWELKATFLFLYLPSPSQAVNG